MIKVLNHQSISQKRENFLQILLFIINSVDHRKLVSKTLEKLFFDCVHTFGCPVDRWSLKVLWIVFFELVWHSFVHFTKKERKIQIRCDFLPHPNTCVAIVAPIAKAVVTPTVHRFSLNALFVVFERLWFSARISNKQIHYKYCAINFSAWRKIRMSTWSLEKKTRNKRKSQRKPKSA